jgi:hypothetical protein
VSVPLTNWLVVHPVTKADTQQSSAATTALPEVIPKIRFVIRHSRGVAVEEVNGPTTNVGNCLRANFTPAITACGSSKLENLYPVPDSRPTSRNQAGT